ncbi:hypothetical protein ACSQ6I_03520 [Anabaena sp. WFMT]|uniref:hypothetical protein n=1 Tax=Anabaena sp. WFMT TaxID=3449730 RepID=UPI003F1E60A2
MIINQQELASRTPLIKQDKMGSGQWYSPHTYYQILSVTPSEKRTEGKYIKTTIVAKPKGEFDQYLIDPATQERLKPYCESPEDLGNSIGSYLPSPGVVLAEGFVDAVFPSNSSQNQRIGEINNFYESTRNLLQSRKISQLIATTWYFYIEARKTNIWNNFVYGKWDEIDAEMLNALIAREIFLADQSSLPSDIDPENIDIYYPLKDIDKANAEPKFMILPNSNAWQGIALSLLMAGQAYREIKKSAKTYYHQISQPILSTGEIVNRYGIVVEWHGYEGKIKELRITPGGSSTAFQAIIPYPPIPSEINLPPEHIKKWAEADDEGEDFPFYSKTEDGKYSIDVNYVTPPYPYLPLTSS